MKSQFPSSHIGPAVATVTLAVTLLSLPLSVPAQAQPPRRLPIRFAPTCSRSLTTTQSLARSRWLPIGTASSISNPPAIETWRKGANAHERDVLDRIHIQAHDRYGLHDAGG